MKLISKKSLLPITLTLLILLAAGAFWFYKSYRSNKSYPSYSPTSSYFSSSSPVSAPAPSDNSPLITPTLRSESRQYVGTDNSTSYTNPLYNFTLTLLPGQKTTSFDEGEGDVVLVSSKTVFKGQPLEDGLQNYEMQITITPFDEDIVLTPERIKKDIPTIKMQNPISVNVGGTPAVSFIDTADTTRQTWFVKDKNLYQIISSPSFDNITGKLMQSWGWE